MRFKKLSTLQVTKSSLTVTASKSSDVLRANLLKSNIKLRMIEMH